MAKGEGEQASIAFGRRRGQPLVVTAGSRGVWRIGYRAGRRGIRPGGGIRLVREAHKFWLGMVKQTEDPGGEDYCAAGSDGPPVALEVPLFYKRLCEARLVVGEPGLLPGGKLWLTCGTPGFPAAVPPFAQRRCAYHVEVDRQGNGSWRRLPQELVVTVAPGPAAKATVVAPSVVAPGEELELRVRLEDRDSNPGAPYRGRVAFSCPDPGVRLPAPYTFTRQDGGWQVFPGCRLEREGVWYVRLEGEGLPETLSNPIRCTRERGVRVYWGDMHNHSEWCDGTDSVEWVYEFGRNRAFLDVCASAEHISATPPDHRIRVMDKPPASSAALWKEQSRQARAWYEPGRFVTFLGYEFTPEGREGRNPANADHCVWFLDDAHPLVVSEDIEELGRTLDPAQVLMAPHVGGRYTRWQYRVPAEVMPVVEVASMHEHSEWFAQQALQGGLKLGMVGMSDGHMGCPGYDMWARHGRSGLHKRAFSPQSAITAFLAPRLDRESIWGALRSRAVYATTGARILLSFECGTTPMGGEVALAGPPCLRVAVEGTAPLDRVQVIRGDRLAYTRECSPLVTGGEPVRRAELEWTDPAPLRGETYYYLRVTQSDNHFAWSSPIWVTCAQGVEPEQVMLPAWNSDLWPPVRPEAVDYLPQVRAHLAQQRCGERFGKLEQVGVFAETRGRYVLVRCRDADRDGRPTHLHYYLGFEDERLYVSAGWADYGQISNQ